MPDHSNHDFEATRERKHPSAEAQHGNESGDTAAYSFPPLHARSLTRAFGIEAHANAFVRATALHTMQHTHGNRAVQRYMQRPTPRQAVPVQRSGLGDIWDTIRKAGSAVGDVMPSDTPPTPDKPLVGPVIGPGQFPVGPVIEGDNMPVPGETHEWPDFEPWV